MLSNSTCAATSGVEIAFMKIDTEGNEFEAWAGHSSTFRLTVTHFLSSHQVCGIEIRCVESVSQ